MTYPIKPKKWYIVDLSNPADPIADRKPYIGHTVAEYVISHHLNNDLRVMIVSGQELLDYGLQIKPHFCRLGIRIYVRKGINKKDAGILTARRKWPWPDYPKENWYAKLRAAFPDEKFSYTKDPNLSAHANHGRRKISKNKFYKNLYKRYQNEVLLSHINH